MPFGEMIVALAFAPRAATWCSPFRSSGYGLSSKFRTRGPYVEEAISADFERGSPFNAEPVSQK